MQLFDFHHHHYKPSGIYNLDLHEEIPAYSFSCGIHPKDIDENFDTFFDQIKLISQNQNCLAIGECGLDSLIDIDEKTQERVFEKHILWANEIRKPVIIHCVRKFSELLKFIKIAETPLVIHGFNKKKIIAEEMLSHGFYLSFGKAVLHNVSLQAIVKDFPLEKIFLETDDKDFNIYELYLKVSEIKEISIDYLHSKILENLENITRL